MNPVSNLKSLRLFPRDRLDICLSQYTVRLSPWIFAREGGDRSTLAGWVGQSTKLLEPLADAIGRHVRAGQAVFADDTPIKMQAKKKCATARIWTYVRDERPWSSGVPPAAWYRFRTGREGKHPTDHLGQFKGWIYADGYLENCVLELDNNPAERSIRCVALGRKNFLFVGSTGGGEAAAIAYTLIETAKLNKVDP